MGMFDRAMDDFVTVRFNDKFDPVDALFQVAAGHAYAQQSGMPLRLCFSDTEVGGCLAKYMRNVSTHDGTYPANVWYGYIGQTEMPPMKGGVTLYSRYRSAALFARCADSLRALFTVADNSTNALVLLDNIPGGNNNSKGFTSLVWLDYVLAQLKGRMQYKEPVVWGNVHAATVSTLAQHLDAGVHQYSRTPEDVFNVIFNTACGNIVMAPNLESWWVKFLRPQVPAVVQTEWPFSEEELNWLDASSGAGNLSRVSVKSILGLS